MLDAVRRSVRRTVSRQGKWMRLAAPAAAEPPTQEAPPTEMPCPYMGLAAFRPENADFFFGREELVARMTAHLAAASLLVVIGPSGCGKSSTVLAGLLPALWRGALAGSDE